MPLLDNGPAESFVPARNPTTARCPTATPPTCAARARARGAPRSTTWPARSRSARPDLPDRAGQRPQRADADYFAMFEVPFLYGGPWTRGDDEGRRAHRGALEIAQREALRQRESRGQVAAPLGPGLPRSPACYSTRGPRCRATRASSTARGPLSGEDQLFLPFAAASTSSSTTTRSTSCSNERKPGLPGAHQLRMHLDPVLVPGTLPRRPRRAARPCAGYAAEQKQLGRLQRNALRSSST